MYTKDKSSRLVSNWLLIGVAMTIVQFALGGITRLTGSGLSITEWGVVTGTFPPMNHQQWMVEFDKYRQTPQFRLINFDFTLSDFKSIFFWEWSHRLWARLIGVVFAVGFVWLLLRRHFKQEMIIPFVILFLLGALQGAVGWVMVASGLTGDAVYVQPARLAVHFIFALGLLCYTFWFALRLRIPKDQRIRNAALRGWNWVILSILTIQLLYGALMAGYKAANVAPTWPTINGQWLPGNAFKDPSAGLNFIDNPLLIHFVHRGIAYLLFVLILTWSWKLSRVRGSVLFRRIRWVPLLVTLLQILLGICTVLSSPAIVPGHWGVFEWLAQLHQLTGMALLLSLVLVLFVVRGKGRGAAALR